MGMIRSSGLVWVGGCAALLFACGVAAFCGLIFSGTVGGVAIGAAPNFSFGLVEPLVCPEGSELAYQEFRRSFDAPGEAEPDVACVNPDGETQDVLLRSMGVVFGLMFLAGERARFSCPRGSGCAGFLYCAQAQPPRILTMEPSERPINAQVRYLVTLEHLC